MNARPLLYLETSIFGFYFDPLPVNRHRQEAVKTLFRQIADGDFAAVTSELTVRELSRAHESIRPRLLDLVAKIEILDVSDDAIERLAMLYLAEGAVPERFSDDARHVACAVLAGADLAVSLNLAHIANEWAERRINAVNLREGYPLLSIRTPEEVIKYED